LAQIFAFSEKNLIAKPYPAPLFTKNYLLKYDTTSYKSIGHHRHHKKVVLGAQFY